MGTPITVALIAVFRVTAAQLFADEDGKTGLGSVQHVMGQTVYRCQRHFPFAGQGVIRQHRGDRAQ